MWISRPHNLKLLLREYPSVFRSRKFTLVYGAEAIFSQRAQDRLELLGSSITPANPLEPCGLDEELALATLADAVVVGLGL